MRTLGLKKKIFANLVLLTSHLGLLVSVECFAGSIPVRHLVGLNETPSSNLTSGICPFLYSTSAGAYCSLYQTTADADARIELDVIAKFDEQAYNDFNQLKSKPTEELVSKIFSEQKFNSASGLVTLSSYFERSQVSFTPLRLIQSYYISNPVFPEVHYVSAQDSILRAQHVFSFGLNRLANGFRPGQLNIGVMPWVVQRSRRYVDSDLSDIITQQKKEKKSSSVHQDVNIVARYVPGIPFFRGITAGVQNLNGGEKCKDCQDHLLDIDLDSRLRWHLSADIGGSFPIGSFVVGVGAERQVEEDSKLPARFSGTAVYKLTSFGLFASFNETITKVGFLYEGDFYKSGIIYTNEKQVNALRFERKNEAFLVLGCIL